MPALSIIFGYRDRETDRLERCIASLAQQTFKDFEVIFVDYGSQLAQAKKVEELLKQYSFCKYVYSDSRGWPWNRSRALNTGAQLATGEYIMTTDVDMIYPPQFLQIFVNNVAPSKVLHVFHHFLPKGFKDWANIENYKNYPVAHNAHGACHCIQREHYEKLGGFDEFYCYWGIEDRDLKEREIAMGLSIESLNDQVVMYHQWHSTANYNTVGFLPQGLWQRMESYFYNNKGILTRNLNGWGKVLNAENRPVLKHLDITQKKVLESDQLHWFRDVPTKSMHISKLLIQFDELPSGHVLAIDNAFYPSRKKWLLFILHHWNRLMRATKLGIELTLNPNLVHGSVYPFIIDSDQVADYYLEFPTKKGVTLLVKR